MPLFTIKHSIFINKPREIVWDYTQDYNLRTHWDKNVLKATVLQSFPKRMIRLNFRGGTIMTLVYKMDERPVRTSLVARDIVSPIIESSGGSWNYEEYNAGTVWTQVNTIVFKNSFLTKILQPLYRFMIKNQIIKSMKKAKDNIEKL